MHEQCMYKYADIQRSDQTALCQTACVIQLIAKPNSVTRPHQPVLPHALEVLPQQQHQVSNAAVLRFTNIVILALELLMPDNIETIAVKSNERNYLAEQFRQNKTYCCGTVLII